MNGNDQLVDQLAQLEEPDFAAVIERVRQRRAGRRRPPADRPMGPDRDAMARWYAAKHLSVDPYIREVVYLPAGAAADEIRLLEVNGVPTTPEDAPVEPLDFGADRDLPAAHRLLVADASPAQWERIKAGALPLPDGWELAGNQIFRRGG